MGEFNAGVQRKISIRRICVQTRTPSNALQTPLKGFSSGFNRTRLQKVHPIREHSWFAYIPQFLQGSSQNMAKVKASPTTAVKKAAKRVAGVEVKSNEVKSASKAHSDGG